MDIRILRLIGGAREAEGVTVVIDVFRAFSLECWLVAMGAAEIRPVGGIEEALSWRAKDPGFQEDLDVLGGDGYVCINLFHTVCCNLIWNYFIQNSQRKTI